MSSPVKLPLAGQGHNQGLSTSLSLSILSGQSLALEGLVNDNPHPKPGLGPGGLTAVMAAAEICGGETDATPKATHLNFKPGDVVPGDYVFDVAGPRPNSAPVTSILEPLLLPLASASEPSSVFVTGGTHVLAGLTSDEFAHVVAPNWRSLGIDMRYTEIAPGFFPEGSGEAEMAVQPCKAIRPLNAQEPFRPIRIGIHILTSGLPVHLAEQAQEGALDRLKLHGLKAETRIRKARGGVGLALLVWAQGENYRVGFSALGRRGGRPEAVANSAVESLITFLKSGAGLPSYQAAHLLATLAAAKGVSRITVDRSTKTLKSAIQAVDLLQPGSIRVTQTRNDVPLEIRVDGFGLH